MKTMEIVRVLLIAAMVAFSAGAGAVSITANTADIYGVDGAIQGSTGSTELRVGQGATIGSTNSYQVGIIPFQLPALSAGEIISGAGLTIQVTAECYYGQSSGQTMGITGCRVATNATVTTADLSGGTVIATNVMAMIDNQSVLGVKTFTQSGLVSYLRSIYDNDTNAAGKYVFLRLTPDAPDTGRASSYLKIASANHTNATVPTLTLTTMVPTNVPSYNLGGKTVFKDVKISTGDPLEPGRRNQLTACVIPFELPDLHGAAILSANMKFSVSSVKNMSAAGNANLNLEAVRSALFSSNVVSLTDYQGLGLRTGEQLIQSDIACWNDSGSLPRNYETTGNATNTLADWLTEQYDNVGIGGTVFLRLAPDQDPGASLRYFQVPAGSVELVITTDGNVDPVSGYGNTVSARICAIDFSWTFDRNVQWGHFIDGMPWVVMPAGGSLNLVSALPGRSNNAAAYVYNGSSNSILTNADINITVKNPPFDHTYESSSYVDNTNGVYGWDSRSALCTVGTVLPKYNASLGWDGVTYLPLSVGDCITTPRSTMEYPMPSKDTVLDALAVLTVLSNAPPADAFRPGVIRPQNGPDRTNPEILRYSDIIDLSPYLISNPVGSSDLRGVAVSSIDSDFTFSQIRKCLAGPGFINTGYNRSEGATARFNNYSYPPDGYLESYGATVGGFTGRLAIGSLADWLTPEDQKICRIRLIQRAVDTYSAVKAGLCMEEGCGIEPGNALLITIAGVMLDHDGMKSVNRGVTNRLGTLVKPWWIFADYATCFHTDGVSINDLAVGEATNNRLVSLHNVSTNRPTLNFKDVQPIAVAASGTMTIRTNFCWAGTSRTILNLPNLKFRITSGAGSGNTIYVITAAVATNLTDAERFRKADGTLLMNYSDGVAMGYNYGGKVSVKPDWQNGTPDTTSVLAFSIMTSDPDNPQSDDAAWYWEPVGVLFTQSPPILDLQHVGLSPIWEYSSILSGGSLGAMIALYALEQQDLYRAGLDKFMINIGTRPGYGEVLFAGNYFGAIDSGTTGNTRGALWRQEVLAPLGADFEYTGQGTAALEIPHAHAKMWYEP